MLFLLFEIVGLPKQFSKFSNKIFDNWQLFALLVLRAKSKLSLENFVEQFLPGNEGLLNALRLKQIPTASALRKFATKVKKGVGYWFTCIINLLVEPTNNTAERALRELVVQRKIIGGLRREKGNNIMQTVMSMITTWKQRGLSLFPTMRLYL